MVVHKLLALATFFGTFCTIVKALPQLDKPMQYCVLGVIFIITMYVLCIQAKEKHRHLVPTNNDGAVVRN